MTDTLRVSLELLKFATTDFWTFVGCWVFMAVICGCIWRSAIALGLTLAISITKDMSKVEAFGIALFKILDKDKPKEAEKKNG